jgi:hypothetical protein
MAKIAYYGHGHANNLTWPGRTQGSPLRENVDGVQSTCRGDACYRPDRNVVSIYRENTELEPSLGTPKGQTQRSALTKYALVGVDSHVRPAQNIAFAHNQLERSGRSGSFNA